MTTERKEQSSVEALIQLEQSENSDFQPDWMNYQQGYMDGMSQAIADMALEKDKPQPKAVAPQHKPEQEPVGWVDDGGEVFWKDKPPADGEDIYTTPPPVPEAHKRTWVGLDNDDLVWIYSNSDTMGQAIENTEAKLKEKNT